MALRILEDGVDVGDIHMPDSHGYTPLHFATLHDLPRTRAKLLADRHCPLEAITLDLRIGHACETGGRTPLLVASAQGHTHVVQELLARGACPAAHDWNGDDALHVAELAERPHTVQWWREYWATQDPPIVRAPLDLVAHRAYIRGRDAVRLHALQVRVLPERTCVIIVTVVEFQRGLNRVCVCVCVCCLYRYC